MNAPFALVRRTLAVFAVAVALCAPARAQPAPSPAAALPAGGKYKECHGYIRHVALTSIKVHCIDGKPSDQSFLTFSRKVTLANGKTVEAKELKADTPVHVLYTQSLGVKKLFRIFVDDPGAGERAGHS